MSAEHDEQSTDLGGPAHGLGLEYQSLVTAWVALELIFKRKRASEIIIEPASHEDIEIILQDGGQSGQASSTVEKLVMQVKIRDGVWPPAKLKDVIGFKEKKRGTRGPPPRKPAWQRLLENPRQAYLLITSGKLPHTLRTLRVSDLLESPGVAPPEAIWPINTAGPTSAVAGRLRVLDDQLKPLVETRIELLLMTGLGVPLLKAKDCIEKLKSRVRARLDGKETSPIWTRDQILVDIREFDGEPTFPEMDRFVPPRGFELARQKLETEHVLFLVGRSGAGKTWAAQKLRSEHQLRPEPFLVQTVTEPRQVHDAPATGPILFVIENPWGASKRGLYADLWVTELPELLDRARPNRRFLVTSRPGSLRAAAGKESTEELMKRAFRLSYEDYDEAARRRILWNELQDAQTWQKEFVRSNENRILESLSAPLSLHAFASSLKSSESREKVDLDNLLTESGIRKIASRIQREILGLDWEARIPALVLWSLLIRRETFSIAEANERAALLWIDDVLPEMERLVHWMAAAGHLTPEQELYRAHPTTIAGLSMLLEEQPDVSRKHLGALLLRLMNASQPRVALEIAAHLGPHQTRLEARIREQVTEQLRTDLLSTPDRQFPEVLGLALRWEEPDPVLMIVRGLTNAPVNRKGFSFLIPSWSRPTWTQEMLEAVRASEQARTVTERFIRIVLPLREDFRPGELPRWLRAEIGWDLSTIFYEAAEKAIDQEAPGVPELVSGALSGLTPPYEELLQKLLAKSDKFDREYQAAMAAEVPREEEEDNENAPTLGDYYYDRFAPIGSGIEQLVRERHKSQGYQWIIEHPRCEALVPSWASIIEYGKPPEQELKAFVTRCSELNPGLAWRTLAQVKHEAAVPELLKVLGRAGDSSLAECARALLRVTSPDTLQDHLKSLAPNWPLQHREEVAWAFRKAGSSPDAPLDFLTMTLIPGAQAALEACHTIYEEQELTEEEHKSLSSEDLKILDRWATDRSNELGQNALIVLAELGRAREVMVREELESQDAERRLIAIQVLRRMAPAWSTALLKAALSDKSPACRTAAMKALAARANAEDWHLILAQASDPDQSVRVTLTRLAPKSASAGPQMADTAITMLCSLLRDQESGEYEWNGVARPVARAAADAIAKMIPLPEAVVDRLVTFLTEGFSASEDVVVHSKVLQLVQSIARPDVTKLLMSLLEKMETSSPNSPERKLRREVAKALLSHVAKYPDVRLDPLDPVVNLAKHVDPELASPGLLLLGLLGGEAAEASCLTYADSIDKRAWRAFIILIGVASRNGSVQEHPASRVPRVGHPAFQLLAWISSKTEVDAHEWSHRWAQYPLVRDWLKDLKRKGKWGRTLLGLFNFVFGNSFVESLSD